jgi:hypothetical protein
MSARTRFCQDKVSAIGHSLTYTSAASASDVRGGRALRDAARSPV